MHFIISIIYLYLYLYLFQRHVRQRIPPFTQFPVKPVRRRAQAVHRSRHDCWRDRRRRPRLHPFHQLPPDVEPLTKGGRIPPAAAELLFQLPHRRRPVQPLEPLLQKRLHRGVAPAERLYWTAFRAGCRPSLVAAIGGVQGCSRGGGGIKSPRRRCRRNRRSKRPLQAVRLENIVLDILRRYLDEHPRPSNGSGGGSSGGGEDCRQLCRLFPQGLLQGLPHEIGGCCRRRQRRSQQPILADGQAITDGTHSIGDGGYHAANGNVGGIFLHSLGGANLLRKRRPSRVFKEGEPPKTQLRELRL